MTKKISGLPAVVTTADTDELEINQGGVSRRITRAQIVGGISDSLFRVYDDGDLTKELAFEASGITTATTRTLTVPDVSGTILVSGDDAITNAEIDALAAIDLSKLAVDPLARAGHTGTQTLSTISDAGTIAALNEIAETDLATALSNAVFYPVTDVLDSVVAHQPAERKRYTYSDNSGAGTVVVLGAAITDAEGAALISRSPTTAPKIVPGDGLTINGSDQTATPTTVADLVLQTASGVTGEFASAGANLPVVTATQIVRLTAHATDNAVYLVTGSPTTSLVAVTRLDGTNFANAASESADVGVVSPLTLKSVASVWRVGTDFIIPSGTSADKDLDTSALTNVGSLAMADGLITRPYLQDIAEVSQSVSSSSNAATIDLENGNDVYTTLTESITTLTLSSPPATGRAGAFTWEVTQGATPYAITWPASVKWAGGTAPTLSAGSGDIDVFTFKTRDAGTTWLAFVAGQNMS